MALLTITEQQTYKPISANWASYVKILNGTTNFEQLQKEVEEKELRKLLGVQLLQDVQTNPGNYATLLSGGSYVDSCGYTVVMKGLKYILAFFNYSKYVQESFISDSFSGLVKKNRDESQNISSGDIKRVQADCQEIAMQEWELIQEYLNLNWSLYPFWLKTKANSPFVPKFRGIKKTIL